MNKSFASLLAVLPLATALQAQSDAGVRFGLKLSPNMAMVHPDNKALKANGAGIGYTFGLMVEFPIGSSDNYRFATGLNLNNMKGKWKQEFSYFDNLTDPKKTRDLETSVTMQYVELPLTVKLMTNEIGYMRYFAVVGAGNAFNVRAKANQVVPVYNSNAPTIVDRFEEQEGEDFKENMALYKASLLVGGGAEYNFSGNTSLMFGLTYSNGFTNILDVEGAKARAHYLELSLGVFF